MTNRCPYCGTGDWCEGRRGCRNEPNYFMSWSQPLTPWESEFNLCGECMNELEEFPSRVEPMGCIGIGGRHRETSVDTDLGRGRARVVPGQKGLRRAAWDLAMGYVSGFRKRDIAYYVLTRSLSRRIQTRVLAYEAWLNRKETA